MKEGKGEKKEERRLKVALSIVSEPVDAAVGVHSVEVVGEFQREADAQLSPRLHPIYTQRT